MVKGLGFRVYASNPLLADARLLGTLAFASSSRASLEPDEIAFIETLTQYVTVAYERLRLNGELREADRRKDEFLATLAHELRNPLAPIRNALQMLKLARGDAGLIEEARAVMERQVGQMVRLVDDLLDVCRITRGKIELRKERVELAAVVDSAVETSRPLIEAAGHELTVALPPEPVVVDADPMRLAQVFSNLLNNAAKYTERGGHIWLTAERRGGEVVVSVRDTGIGIAAEHLPHALRHVLAGGPRRWSGRRAGWASAWRWSSGLVEMHGGTVEARSDGPGKGSEFVVRLPAAEAPPDVPAESGIAARGGRPRCSRVPHPGRGRQPRRGATAWP